MNIDHGDINRIRNIDLASCEATCRATNGCLAYSFDKWNSDCYLKSSIPEFLQDPVSDAGIRGDVPEPRPSPNTLKTCVYNNSILSGIELKTTSSVSADVCQRRCEEDVACAVYTYFRPKNRCTLFSNPSARTSKQNHAVSGIRTQRKCY